MPKRVLVAYFSASGTTETMASYVGEGVRIAGHDAEVKKVSDFRAAQDLGGFDGYVFGCPTYHLDLPEAMKAFLDLAAEAGLAGKAGGAFSMSAHPGGREGGTAGIIFDRMEKEFGMKMTSLGPFNLTEDLFDHPDFMRSCHDYGRVMGEML